VSPGKAGIVATPDAAVVCDSVQVRILDGCRDHDPRVLSRLAPRSNVHDAERRQSVDVLPAVAAIGRTEQASALAGGKGDLLVRRAHCDCYHPPGTRNIGF